ncbi:hypothetical protein GCM10023088_57140 [Actinomadura verrucosospora]
MTIAVFSATVKLGGHGFVVRLSRKGIRRAAGWEATAPLNGQHCLTRAAFDAAFPLAAGFGAKTASHSREEGPGRQPEEEGPSGGRPVNPVTVVDGLPQGFEARGGSAVEDVPASSARTRFSTWVGGRSTSEAMRRRDPLVTAHGPMTWLYSVTVDMGAARHRSRRSGRAEKLAQP